MDTFKKVKYYIPAYDIDMGGIPVKQALPTQKVQNVDPFLLLHHGTFSSTDKAPAIQQGLGPHPHRGFTPVTFVIEGEVHHRDSRGNNQIAKKGEVQWMHAGAGILHSERPSEALAQQNGKQEIIQLWINSPASKKMNQPHYQHIKEDQFPTFNSVDGHVHTKLIAGQYEFLIGKIVTESNLLVLWGVTGKNNGIQDLHIPEGMSSMLYTISGGLRIKGYGLVEKESLVVFENDANAIQLSLDSNTQYLLLCGAPLNEKVVQQGPFVMNSETEIMEAMRDYQMGKMGMLIEE